MISRQIREKGDISKITKMLEDKEYLNIITFTKLIRSFLNFK
ncbi:MAG TPA: hypothetical protein PK993_00205 [Clostridia bacterium]|nr:hypothetical protein [Clostridia bacterium]